ncbi:MAG: hypothetical protein ABH829_04435 [archaeon]
MRGQFTPIGAILIVAILIALISWTYLWAIPVIEKQKTAVLYEYSKSELEEMRDAVRSVAGAEGAQRTVNVNLKSLEFRLNERGGEFSNSIDMKIGSDVKLLSDSWSVVDSSEDDKEAVGVLGEDNAGVIIGKQEKGILFLRLWYRDLYDSQTKNYYRINLVRSTPWIVESGRQEFVLKNTAQYKEGGYITTNITVSVK